MELCVHGTSIRGSQVLMRKVRVLVADDNKAMRDMLISILGAEYDVFGRSVTAARHSPQLLTWFRTL
jgi:CheY-like chemotaxis protein